MPTFPTAALLRRTGFAHKRPSALLRTPMEQRFVKQTKVVSRVLVARQVTYLFETKTDYNAFITWFKDTIAYGALWFDWTDPVDATTKSARIVDGTLEDRPLNGALSKWDVTFQIETWSA